MFRPKGTALVFLVVGLMVSGPVVHSQEAALSEREAMYRRYLEFASYVKGGSIQPHRLTGTARTYWWEAIRRYFQEHLKP